MAEQRVKVVTADGTVGTVPQSELAQFQEQGGHLATRQEAIASQEAIARTAKENKPLVDLSPKGIAETYAAGLHSDVRGVASAFGVPLDAAATGIAETVGGEEAGKATAGYLKHLDEEHPYISKWMDIMGTARGAIGAAELAGAPGRVSAGVVPRTIEGVAGRVGVGGIENVIQGSAKDINEDSLGAGKAVINGEKLWAHAPKHFLVGAAATGAFEGLGAAAESGIAALTKRAEPALEAGASKAVGREMGLVGEEAATVGERVRNASAIREGVTVPKDRNQLLSILEAEQAASRKGSGAAHAAKVSETETEHIVQAAGLAEKRAAGRTGVEARGKQAATELENMVAEQVAERKGAQSYESYRLRDDYDALRLKLREEGSASREALDGLNAQRSRVDRELRETLKKADKEGVYDPGEAADLIAGFTGRRKGGFQWTMDDPVLRAQQIRESSSRSVQSNIDRLTGLRDHLDASIESTTRHLGEVANAENRLNGEFASRMSALDRQAERDLAAIGTERAKGLDRLERGVANDVKGYDKATEREFRAQDKAQAKELRDLGKAPTTTEFDPLIASVKERANAAAERPAIGLGGVYSTVTALAHGHPFAAVGSLLSSLASGRIRANGNLTTARALAAIADQLRTVDSAVENGAASIFGKAAAKATAAAVREPGIQPKKEPAREPEFETVRKQVLAAKGNPQLVERHVQAQLGGAVTAAPETYSATLAAAYRAQHFLESFLPAKQVDPKSLRPDLQRSDISDTEKYDFMQYVKALGNPLKVFDDVRSGSVTDQQVEAIKFVAPDLYRQMQDEVRWQAMMSTSPLDYEREIHVGTLLGVETDQVLERQFQQTQTKSFQQKEEAGKPKGSKAPGGDAKASKDMMSASQQVERGE